jgi:zinc transporter, ZIP family
MPDTLPWLLTYTLTPVAAIVLGGCAAALRPQGRQLISAFEHFAAGVVFSAVAIELLPRLHEIDQPLPMVAGFVAGVFAMMASRRWFEAAGSLVPTAVDLFIDGLLIAIGLAAGTFGGMLLLAGLTIEALSIGLASTPALVRHGACKAKAIATMGALGVMIMVGAAAGYASVGVSPPALAAILGFGVSALLYLVTEDLLLEAHETADTPAVTATFFLGFLIPLVLTHL